MFTEPETFYLMGLGGFAFIAGEELKMFLI